MKFERYPTRTIKNYFPLPNEIFMLDLNSNEIAIYSYLMSLENEKYQCWPSYKTIGKHCKLSKNTVKKYVDSLCEKRLIETEYTNIFTKDGLKLNGNLKYTIRPIYESIKYNFEKQCEKNELKMRKHSFLYSVQANVEV